MRQASQAMTENGVRQSGSALLGATVEALVGTLGLRDDGTSCHSEEVAVLSCRLGRTLGFGPRALRDLGYAAQLHDIGKVGVPDAVLLKRSPLSPPEWTLLKGHAAWGAELLERVPGLNRVAHIVRHHHERFDGQGYPDGLAGDDIPAESRVLCVADSYSAMTERRPYRGPLEPTEVEQELLHGRGSQFDPEVVDALLNMLHAGAPAAA